MSLSLPIIDLGPYLAGEPGAAAHAAKQLAEASEEIGFYFIANHGVAQSLIDRVFVEAERFHHLPLDRKDAVKAIGQPVGYLGLGGQTQRAEMYGTRSAHPDRSASFYIRNEFGPGHPDRLAQKPWVTDNRWPADLPGFRETCLAYFDALAWLQAKLLPLQALALELPADWFTTHPAFQPLTATLRLLHYPPREPANAGQYGIGPHTDFTFCTILAQAKKPGLEILTKDGAWIAAPAHDGMFLVNNADMLRRWTNDRFRSAPHRVFNLEGDERFSIPFFVGTRADVQLACLPSCQGTDNPPRYPPLSQAEYFAELHRTVYDGLPQNAAE